MSERTHPATFRPRARLLEILGDQLIRHHRIALFELIKNAYDADAPSVDVRMLNPTDPEHGLIEVRDTGEGMDLKTIVHAWLEPASDHKAQQREQRVTTPLYGRLPVGEKGVGRFAVQKLGRHLCMVTRRAGQAEFVLDIDWDSFSSAHYLSDAELKITEREPQEFKGDSHGTLLRITGLNHEWTRGDVRRLYRAVNAMISPFGNGEKFEVEFSLEPDQGWLEELFSAEKAKEFSLFEFEFFLSDEGFDWEYKYRPLPSLKVDYPELIEDRTESKKSDPTFEFFHLAPPDDESPGWRGRSKRNKKASLSSLGIGPVMGRVLVFDLDKRIKTRIGDVQGLTQFLKEQGGIRVYRDGMRVYDYGEPGNDWLGLDERRVQIPTRRLSNGLVLGEVHLDLMESPALKEKTNREGFIENEAYRELQYAVLCALTVLESERARDRKAMVAAFKTNNEGDTTGIYTPEKAIDDLRRAVIKEGLVDQFGKYVDRVEKSYTDAREVLMSAVGAGLGLSLVFHEIERGVRGLASAIEKGESGDRLVAMTRQLVEMLEGSAILVRRSARETCMASELFRYAAFTNKARCEYHGIRLIDGFDGLPELDFSITGSRRMLTASLSNLLDNAIHWIKTLDDEKDGPVRCIWVGPSLDLEGPAVIVADSGPGFQIPPDDAVRPFYTRRMDGMGLGLYYADMAMKTHGGRLAFPEHSDVNLPAACTGAVVAMVFGGEA